MAESNIIKVQNNFIEGLNKFNGLLTKNVLDLDGLKFVIDKYKIDNFIIKRMISYMYNYPNILIYLNKYLNYLGIAQCDLIEFIRAYRYILQCNSVLDSRRFYYLKSAAGKDDLQMKIIDLLNRYFVERFDIHFNYKELLFFYDLYLNNVITNQDIYEVDLLVNNNSKTINLGDFKPEKKEEAISVNKLIKQYSEISTGVELINNEVHKRKLEYCQSCQYFGREVVPFDGNINSINNVDVLIINLHPDLLDLKEKRTFREKSIIRYNISLFPRNIKWLLVNLVPCVFKSKSELGKKVDDILEFLNNGCNKVIFNYIKENVKPKFVILVGEECTLAFLPAGKFDDILGQLTDEKYISVLHPNSMRQPKSQIRGKLYWENIQELLKGYVASGEVQEEVVVEEQPKPAAEKKEVKVIEEDIIPEPVETKEYEINKPKKTDKKKLLLLDVKEIEDGKSVLIILTDEQGNKYYEKKRNITPGYIKNTSFKECDILADSVDIEFNMNKMEKLKLMKLLREKMSKLKGI